MQKFTKQYFLQEVTTVEVKSNTRKRKIPLTESNVETTSPVVTRTRRSHMLKQVMSVIVVGYYVIILCCLGGYYSGG